MCKIIMWNVDVFWVIYVMPFVQPEFMKFLPFLIIIFFHNFLNTVNQNDVAQSSRSQNCMENWFSEK